MFKDEKIAKGLNRTHVPKGGMCFTCEKLSANCSNLDFENMPIIRITDNGTRIVKCIEHVRIKDPK